MEQGKRAAGLPASGLPHLQHQLGKHPLGVITAFHAAYTREENRRRSRKLLAQLLRARMEVTVVEGRYREDQDASAPADGGQTAYIVANPAAGAEEGALEGLLCELGNAYEQDALVMVDAAGEAERVGLSDRESARPGPGVREKIGRVTPEAAALSELLSSLFGRPFVVASVRVARQPGTLFGKMALKAVAENDWRQRPDGEA